ncbi:helix-turn-helix domain-containing protein [Streptomyces olivaceus]|uniref:helix-turn-helix domain-containing protein n=1 Tax=Streptomyces olivaceus TaxID=47716 RepID=UPI0036B3E6BF
MAETDERGVDQLGRRLSALRARAGYTISALAASAGVSQGLVSQIERGTGNPSYTTLIKLADALRVPVGTFFEGSEDAWEPSTVVRAASRRRLSLSDEGLVYELLTPSLRGHLGMMRAEIPPGYNNASAPHQHEGEEVMLLLAGTLHITVGNKVSVLKAGDTITYDASVPHHFHNKGDSRAVIVGAMTPPSF